MRTLENVIYYIHAGRIGKNTVLIIGLLARKRERETLNSTRKSAYLQKIRKKDRLLSASVASGQGYDSSSNERSYGGFHHIPQVLHIMYVRSTYAIPTNFLLAILRN